MFCNTSLHFTANSSSERFIFCGLYNDLNWYGRETSLDITRCDSKLCDVSLKRDKPTDVEGNESRNMCFSSSVGCGKLKVLRFSLSFCLTFSLLISLKKWMSLIGAGCTDSV